MLGGFEWLRPQPAEHVTEFKSSWYLPNAKPAQLARIRRALKDAGLIVNSNNDGMRSRKPATGPISSAAATTCSMTRFSGSGLRANICFGRMLESAGDAPGAGAFMQSSQRIRERVLEVFWPTTGGTARARPDLFTQRQASLGDTQYLLAEMTPFSFSWRCDLFANILAFLMNLLDLERARQAFHFMWGVGVNRPWPVANLYPVVQAGDPDWRAYYTVNLLNLPNHYHNGGIWPFIGGFWVRFIHRLGLHDVACHELVQLAKANRLAARTSGSSTSGCMARPGDRWARHSRPGGGIVHLGMSRARGGPDPLAPRRLSAPAGAPSAPRVPDQKHLRQPWPE